MINSIIMMAMGLLITLFSYRLYKKVSQDPCKKFKNLLSHKDFKSVLLLFIVAFGSISAQYVLLGIGGVVFSAVLHVTNNSLLIICFFYMQHLIK